MYQPIVRLCLAMLGLIILTILPIKQDRQRFAP